MMRSCPTESASRAGAATCPAAGTGTTTRWPRPSRASGSTCDPDAVSGSWPLPAPGDRARLGALLTAERRWLIGNIVASAAPEAVRAATADGRRVTLLVHYFPRSEERRVGKECRSRGAPAH